MQQQKWQKVSLAVIGVAVIGLIGLVVSTGLKQNQTAETKAQLQVVASLPAYGEMARAVLGDQGAVETIINKPTMDPHDYEPTAQVAKQYQGADVIVSNGGGYDAWSEKFAQANPEAKSVVVADLYNYHDGDNEHFWYAPDVATKLTDDLVKTYSQLLPEKRDYFMANAKAYQSKMDKVAKLRTELAPKVKGLGILATEPVYDLTLKSMGVKRLDPAFASAVEEGQDPTPAAMRTWQSDITSGQAKLVINNKQHSSRLVQQAVDFAKDHEVPIVAVTETMPADMTYIDWQYDQLQALAKVVGE